MRTTGVSRCDGVYIQPVFFFIQVNRLLAPTTRIGTDMIPHSSTAAAIPCDLHFTTPGGNVRF